MNRKTRADVFAILLVLVALLALFVGGRILFVQKGAALLVPDYAPQKEDTAAQRIPGEAEGKLEAPEGGSSVSLTYSNQLSLDLSTGHIDLYFANPGRSNQDVVLQLVIQEQPIARSGLIKPGHQLKSMALPAQSAGLLSQGIYEGLLVVSYYAPDSGEKAIVDTKIDVFVNVTNGHEAAK